MKLGVVGALWAKLFTNALLFLIVLWLNRQLIWRPWQKYYVIRALQFSIPLLPFLLINWLQIYGDRFILERYLDLKTVGVYSLLITIVGVLPMAIDAVINGIRPFLFDYLKEGIDQHIKSTKELFRLYFGFSLLMASGVILLGNNIHLFTSNKEYYQILPYLSIMTIAFFVRVYSTLLYILLLFQKKTKLISQLSIGLIFILLGGYFLLIPIWGIWGAIWSSLIGNIFMTIALTFLRAVNFRFHYLGSILLAYHYWP